MRRLPAFLLLITSFGVLAMAPAPAAASAGKGDDPYVHLELDSFNVPGDPQWHKHTVTCPSGYSAIVGSFREIQPGLAISTSEATGPTGRKWTFEVNYSGGGETIVKVQVRCVHDSRFVRKTTEVKVTDSGDYAGHTAMCPKHYRGLGHGERISKPGPPDDDPFAAYFREFYSSFGATDDEIDYYLYGIDSAGADFDYYVSLYCFAPDNRKAGAHIKVQTITKTKTAPIEFFGDVNLKCPRGTYPASAGFDSLPDGVSAFTNIPGTAHAQPVRFLNGSGKEQKLRARLLCIKLVR